MRREIPTGENREQIFIEALKRHASTLKAPPDFHTRIMAQAEQQRTPRLKRLAWLWHALTKHAPVLMKQHLENLRRNAQYRGPQYGLLLSFHVNNPASNFAHVAMKVAVTAVFVLALGGAIPFYMAWFTPPFARIAKRIQATVAQAIPGLPLQEDANCSDPTSDASSRSLRYTSAQGTVDIWACPSGIILIRKEPRHDPSQAEYRWLDDKTVPKGGL